MSHRLPSIVIVGVLLTLLSGPRIALAAHAGAHGKPYASPISGQVVGFRLAGIEPDGDPLNQVLLRTRFRATGNIPALNLIVNTYLENFKPDTTPILPDLLHPNQNAQNLGGFLQGKGLIVDDAGNPLYIGSFLAEAFLNNSNHVVLDLFGTGAASGGHIHLKGMFLLTKNATLAGSFTGRLSLPAAAVQQFAAHRGERMKPLKQIINVVSVTPHAMVGRATAHSASVPLHTNYGSSSHRHPAGSTTSGRTISPVTIIAGIGAIVSLLVGLYLLWLERRDKRNSRQKALLDASTPTE